jgi:hypothetical protein
LNQLRGQGWAVADPEQGFCFPLSDNALAVDKKLRELLPHAFSLIDEQIPTEVNDDPLTMADFPQKLKWLLALKIQRQAVVAQNLPFPGGAALKQQTENGRK